MRTIGSYELKTHLAQVLDDVEQGQSVIVTRHGKPIARIIPDDVAVEDRTKKAVQGLRDFQRVQLPTGVTIRSLIDEGRR